MLKFIQIELKYWLKKPMILIFLFINTALVFFAIASEHVSIGGSFGNLHKNAPYIIQQFYMAFSIVCLVSTAVFMNATANRDFQYGMYPFVFTSPISKNHYYFGKFLGATIVSVLPILGISIGILLGAFLSPYMPSFMEMCPSERFGEIYWSAHFWGIINFAIPNVIIAGGAVFALAILFRSNIVSFIGTALILVFYVLSGSFLKDIEKEWLASLLDPFGVKSFEIMTKYLTVDEKNTVVTVLKNELLWNRLGWLLFIMLVLGVVYYFFSFEIKNASTKNVSTNPKKYKPIPTLSNVVFEPTKAGHFSYFSFWKICLYFKQTYLPKQVIFLISRFGKYVCLK